MRIFKHCLLLILTVFSMAITPASASFLISEILYDGAGTDSDDVFTELVGTPNTPLDGWLLLGINGVNGSVYRTVQLDGAVIPDDGLLLITTSSAKPELLLMADMLANVDWQNGPDTVQLWNPLDQLIDAIQYGDAGINNAGLGLPAVDIGPGKSLERVAASGNNQADFRVQDQPTPGQRITQINNTGTANLLMAALLMVIGFRCRYQSRWEACLSSLQDKSQAS